MEATNLQAAREEFNQINNWFRNTFNKPDYAPQSEGGIMLYSKEGNKMLPTNTYGWDYDTIPGLKMQVFTKDIEGKDVFLCIATEDVVITKHKHEETEIVYLLHGRSSVDLFSKETGDFLRNETLNEQEKITIPAGVGHEFTFTKGSMFTVTFIPKIKK